MVDQSTFDDTHHYIDQNIFTFVFADVRGYGKSIKLQGTYNSSEISGDIFELADSLVEAHLSAEQNGDQFKFTINAI